MHINFLQWNWWIAWYYKSIFVRPSVVILLYHVKLALLFFRVRLKPLRSRQHRSDDTVVQTGPSPYLMRHFVLPPINSSQSAQLQTSEDSSSSSSHSQPQSLTQEAETSKSRENSAPGIPVHPIIHVSDETRCVSDIKQGMSIQQ